jgi:hypothetical protein
VDVAGQRRVGADGELAEARVFIGFDGPDANRTTFAQGSVASRFGG